METRLQKYFLQNSKFRFQNELFYQNDLPCPSEFEKNYLELRKKEGRLYTDEEIISLPNVASSSIHLKEWNIRKRSTDKLVEYFKNKNINTVIELGCGNGWLIRYVGKHIQASFCGIDVNERELLQAARVNSNQDCFAYADIFSPALTELRSDIFILASCIQYFPDLKALLTQLLAMLNKDGEIHIVDSPIYNNDRSSKARQRSKEHFARFDADLMSNFYNHHTWQNLQSFSYKVLYNPHNPMNFFGKKYASSSPFPWIVIKK